MGGVQDPSLGPSPSRRGSSSSLKPPSVGPGSRPGWEAKPWKNLENFEKFQNFQNFKNRLRIDSASFRGDSRHLGRVLTPLRASRGGGGHGIDPRSISEVLKILIFSKFSRFFQGLASHPGLDPRPTLGGLSEEGAPLLGGEAPSAGSWTPHTCCTCPRGHRYPGGRSRAVPGAARAAQAG